VSKSPKPDGAVAGSTNRLALRFYQQKTGHFLSGQYLHWTKNRVSHMTSFFYLTGNKTPTAPARNERECCVIDVRRI